jgi:hypothetical protein
MLWEADLEICCGVVNDSWGRSVLFTRKKWAIDWDCQFLLIECNRSLMCNSFGRFYENPLRRRQVRSLAKNIKIRQVLIWFAEI